MALVPETAVAEPQTPPEPEPEKEGIRCPRCNCGHFWVVWVRRRAKTMVRRRECRNCGRRITCCDRIIGH